MGMVGGINKAIQQHARTSYDWKHQQIADKAYTIFGAVNEYLYKLALPEVIIGFDDRLKKAGEYYFEGDNMSLPHHFDIRTDLSEIELTISVIHNAVHAFQDVHKAKGTWYHSALFRDEMKGWGIIVDSSGDVYDIDFDIFGEVLGRIGLTGIRDHLVDFEISEAQLSTGIQIAQQQAATIKQITTKTPKKNKMKKWSCTCNPPTNIRCYTNVTAYCTTCNTDFEQMEP